MLLVFCGCSAVKQSDVPTYTGTAEDAWSGLVGAKGSKRAAFAFVENDACLPNVLIYGDSISADYTQEVRQRLEGKANVYRIHCNGGDSASFIGKMRKMHEVMGDEKNQGYWSFEWDVIHFNVGLHDLKYWYNGALDKKKGTQVTSTDEYAANLRRIVAYLNKLAPKAKLIFATTTPVPKGGRGRYAADGLKYNKTALKVLKDHPKIIVNDLYGFTKPNQPKWWTKPGNVHFNADGCSAQGGEVSRIILKAIDPEDR